MGKIQMQADSHDLRLQQARHIFFDQGMVPEGLVAQQIARSWERCRRFGLNEKNPFPIVDGLDRFALKTEQDRNRTLLQQGRAIMEQVYEQIRESGSMVYCWKPWVTPIFSTALTASPWQPVLHGMKTSVAPTPSAPHCSKKPRLPYWAANTL